MTSFLKVENTTMSLLSLSYSTILTSDTLGTQHGGCHKLFEQSSSEVYLTSHMSRERCHRLLTKMIT